MIKNAIYGFLDKCFLRLDKNRIRRNSSLELIPQISGRRGGKIAYGEWAYVIGVFQTVFSRHLRRMSGNRFLDIGCGTGLLGIACEPFMDEGGHYVGIDVQKRDVDFCQSHYPSDLFTFQHLPVRNAMYSPDEEVTRTGWDIENESIDLLSALSVWTHFGEDDSIFYLREVDRVLRKGSRAVITFFVLDDAYRASLDDREHRKGRHYNTPADTWIFDSPCSDSGHWWYRRNAKHPENAIAVDDEALGMMMEGTSLRVVETHSGNWKGAAGVYFQDIVVFEKGSEPEA